MQLLSLLHFLLVHTSPGMTSNPGEGLSWDAFCKEYEQRVEPFTSQFAEELIAGLPNAKAKGKLLDVGCGTGTVALLTDGWDVAVTDVSCQMVQRTLERCDNVMDSAIVDGMDLPLRWSNSFDVAMANFSVIFFPQPLKGLKEIHRCLVSSGMVGITAWGDASETPAFHVFPYVLLENHPELVDSNRPKRITGSRKVLQKLLEDSGFVDVRVHKVVKTLVVKNASDYYDRFAKASPPTAATIAKMTKNARSEFKKRIMEVATERGSRDDGSIALNSTAYIAYGRKP